MSDKLLNILLLLLCAVLFMDNFLVRKQLKIIEDVAKNVGVDIEKIEEEISIFKVDLKKNAEEDDKFRAQQTNFDKNIIGVLKEKGLLER